MCQLHINRGEILELGLSRAGGFATGRAELGSYLCRGIFRRSENSVQLNHCVWTVCQVLCPTPKTRKESDLNSVFEPFRVQLEKNACVKQTPLRDCHHLWQYETYSRYKNKPELLGLKAENSFSSGLGSVSYLLWNLKISGNRKDFLKLELKLIHLYLSRLVWIICMVHCRSIDVFDYGVLFQAPRDVLYLI